MVVLFFLNCYSAFDVSCFFQECVSTYPPTKDNTDATSIATNFESDMSKNSHIKAAPGKINVSKSSADVSISMPPVEGDVKDEPIAKKTKPEHKIEVGMERSKDRNRDRDRSRARDRDIEKERLKSRDRDRGRDSDRAREQDDTEMTREKVRDRAHHRSKDRGKDSGLFMILGHFKCHKCFCTF